MISPHSDTDKTFMPYYSGLQLNGEKVYKGYVDPVNMRLTVTGAMEIFDGSDDEGWSVQASAAHYNVYTDLLNGIIDYNKTLLEGISSVYRVTTEDATWNETTGLGIASNGNIRIYDPRFNTSDITLWTNYLSNNPLQLCYELAAPRTYGINNTELKSLLGVNNISADTGEIAVTFRRDANLVINSLIARIEALEGGNA
jgi:hypothetical protein